MDLNKIKDISIFQLILSWGFTPVKLTDKEAWFYALNRKENTPSLRVNLLKNRFYDFGSGDGGSVIDMIIYVHHCDVSEALKMLSEFVPAPDVTHLKIEKESVRKTEMKIVNVSQISNTKLNDYILSRGVSLEIAKQFCQQIDFSLNGRTYFAIGFKNEEGGFELRNAFYKGSTSPKTITFFRNGHKRLMMFEGFFDFLSILTIDSKLFDSSDFLVLNSLSFLKRIEDPFYQKYETVDLFFDCDNAGRVATEKLVSSHSNCIDRSLFYEPHKDLNEWLKHNGQLNNSISLLIK